MEPTFLLNFPEIEKVREQYGLSIEKLLSVGSSSEVYQCGRHVIRLSTDGSTQALIEFGDKNGLSVPKMIKNYGLVARLLEGFHERDLWLCEVEKMEGLDAVLKSHLESWIDSLVDNSDCDQLVSPSEFTRLKETLENDKEHYFSDIKKTILEFIKVCDGELDLDITNFMQRQSTKEIVWIDPAHGMYL